MKLKGTFQIINWDESTISNNDDGSKNTMATVTQKYTGDLQGESTVNYLLSYQVNGDACFVGFETITCTIENNRHSLTIKHDGQFSAGKAKGNFIIINATDKLLVNQKGNFESTENGMASYQLN